MRLIFFYFSLFLFVWGYEVDAGSIGLKIGTKVLHKHWEKKDQKDQKDQKEKKDQKKKDKKKKKGQQD